MIIIGNLPKIILMALLTRKLQSLTERKLYWRLNFNYYS